MHLFDYLINMFEGIRVSTSRVIGQPYGVFTLTEGEDYAIDLRNVFAILLSLECDIHRDLPVVRVEIGQCE